MAELEDLGRGQTTPALKLEDQDRDRQEEALMTMKGHQLSLEKQMMGTAEEAILTGMMGMPRIKEMKETVTTGGQETEEVATVEMEMTDIEKTKVESTATETDQVVNMTVQEIKIDTAATDTVIETTAETSATKIEATVVSASNSPPSSNQW